MAARTGKIRHDTETRAKIQASQLINRLTKHALNDVEIMTQSQVRAAEVLLKKSLPDLSSVDLSANVDGNLTIQVVRLTDADSTATG